MNSKALMNEPERKLPVLYSFRRCPYAMRARLAIAKNNTLVELREVLLRDKPNHMLSLSPKGTVPVLWLCDGTVIDESFEIMNWAYSRDLPDNFSKKTDHEELIVLIDSKFKYHLDRYKYSSRFKNINVNHHRDCALNILYKIEDVLELRWLNGITPGFSDFAILPFVRQYRIADKNWFDSSIEIPKVRAWLNDFLNWEGFKDIMRKYPQWHEGHQGIQFGFKS
jgi:glutathione S-transferase